MSASNKAATKKKDASSRRWTPSYAHSGVFPGETVGAAIRRHVAWLALAREQLDMTGDTACARIDLAACASALATLSLEVDDLECEASDARSVAS